MRFFCLITALTISTAALAEPAAKSEAPPAPRAVIAALQALPKSGIDVLDPVMIGGIKQWIHVRGTDPANPILLFIHGGPGSPMMPESWTFQRPWEDYFTVVQWDQRGAGKTLSSAGRKPDPSLTLDRMESDADEVIVYLRKTYGKKKIFLMGHSWGSILGLKVAQHHPEWLYAYIGVGQVVNAARNESVGYQETLAKAKEFGNAQAVKELEAIAPYPGPPGGMSVQKVVVERKWDVALGGMMYGRTSDVSGLFRSLSPDYTDDDLLSYEMGEGLSVQALLPGLLSVDFDNVTKFGCPIFFFAGVDDRTTPESIVESYYPRIEAPKKGFFKIAHAAHYVVNEAPGVVLVDLVTQIRPLAQ
jgi:pimeloyl-ACP methyl ester carboxylesterase